MIKIALFISGGLGLQSLITILENRYVDLKCVFTDNNSVEIINFCNKNEIALFKGNPRNNSSNYFVKEIGEIDLIFSINYLFIIENDLISFPKFGAFNIHGSLLPKYRGRTPHVWAIINGEKNTGVTVHRITRSVDAGDILLQKTLPILETDTGADILKKYNIVYPEIINKTINLVKNKKLFLRKQDDSKATYYGKRTPEDGNIDWNWDKVRIRNWIRALSKPYSGAFTNYKNKKLIINKVGYSEMGYNYNIKNGTILSNSPLVVKTPNGAVELFDYYFEDSYITSIEKNYTLGI